MQGGHRGEGDIPRAGELGVDSKLGASVPVRIIPGKIVREYPRWDQGPSLSSRSCRHASCIPRTFITVPRVHFNAFVKEV